jgi:hypothetical protein
MGEQRFYVLDTYTCPICLNPLKWEKRTDLIDSMILIHDKPHCPNSGKKFYVPAKLLTEYREKDVVGS